MQKGVPLEMSSLDMGGNVVQCKPNIQKFIESMEKNPNPNLFYTVQINSFEDLKKRVTESQEVAGKIKQRLDKDIDMLNQYKKTCDEELEQKIVLARKKNEVIAKKLMTVYGKFEEYLSQVSGQKRLFKAEHDQLNEQYQEQIDRIQDPRNGLLKKLRDLQTRIRLGMQAQSEQ